MVLDEDASGFISTGEFGRFMRLAGKAEQTTSVRKQPRRPRRWMCPMPWRLSALLRVRRGWAIEYLEEAGVYWLIEGK